MKIAEDLGQILVVLHTLLVIIEMIPRLNKQSGSDRTGRTLTGPVSVLKENTSARGWKSDKANHNSDRFLTSQKEPPLKN